MNLYKNLITIIIDKVIRYFLKNNFTKYFYNLLLQKIGFII